MESCLTQVPAEIQEGPNHWEVYLRQVESRKAPVLSASVSHRDLTGDGCQQVKCAPSEVNGATISPFHPSRSFSTKCVQPSRPRVNL